MLPLHVECTVILSHQKMDELQPDTWYKTDADLASFYIRQLEGKNHESVPGHHNDPSSPCVLDQQRFPHMTAFTMLKETDLPIEVVILLIAGMTMLITGILLFPVSAGALPYYENGLYGLLLVMFALQVITLGKTPFGDIRRSKFLLAAGVMIAAVGIVTCFVPDLFIRLSRLLLFVCLGPGGFLLLLQMGLDQGKLRSWLQYGGIFRHLILGCSLVYGLSMVIALLLWKRDLLTTPMTAVAVLLYGAAILYLAGVLRKIYGAYPELGKPSRSDFELSTDQAMLLLMGIFMLLLGVLLIPVNLGLLPFSASAQLGLLMVMFAVQMLASGSTPLGPFPRSGLLVLFGLLLAALGIISCIIPEILVAGLTVLVGVLNILGGILTLTRIGIPRLKKSAGPREPVPPVLAKLFAAQLIMNLITVLFGLSMLVAHRIPGLVIGVILAANGCVLLYLLHLLTILESLRASDKKEGGRT